MNKKAIIITLVVLFISNAAFGIRAVTKAEHEAYLKGLGLSQAKITKLDEIDRNYLEKRLEISNQSRQYRRQNPTLTKEECDRYHTKLVLKAQKDYEKELNKVLNYWQKKRYLEYKSRRY